MIKSKNKHDDEKLLKNLALTDSFDGFGTNKTWEVAQTSRMSRGREKPDLGKNSNTLSLEKSDNFRIKSFSEALMRKKLKSVCYTRR